MLKDKVIIIAGGSGLIGKEVLRDILKNHGNVINFDIIESGLNKVDEIKCDITNIESVVENLNIVKEKYKKIDGLVNCSYPRTKDWGKHPVENIPIDAWKENVDIHLNSYFFLSQKVLEIMKESREGSLINFASIYGVVGNDFTIYEGLNMYPPAAYSAIKGGLINLTRYLAAYYGQYNVRVNCVSPGGIFDKQNEEFVKRYESKVPMRRMGKPADIAPTVSFLLSDGTQYITGQNLIIDGGWTAI